MDTIKTLKDAVDLILSSLTPSNIMDIRNIDDVDDIYMVLDDTNIRNVFGLWDEHSDIFNWFVYNGIYHADDMSHCVMVEVWNRVNNKDSIDLKEFSQEFKEYWDCQNIDQKSLCLCYDNDCAISYESTDGVKHLVFGSAIEFDNSNNIIHNIDELI